MYGDIFSQFKENIDGNTHIFPNHGSGEIFPVQKMGNKMKKIMK